MANQRHFKLLKRGVRSWNTWRARHFGIQPHLVEVHLSCWDLGGVDLSEANLFHADLVEAILTRANLRQACLGGERISRKQT
jgi:uncharacterized protein YjbI with pentapeptide repeats